jgi:hypothetical protein
MKKLLYAMLVIGVAILCLPVEMLAQDTLNVDPLPAGNLNTVINSDTLAGGVRAHPDRVYRLARGKYYQLTEEIRPNGNLMIVANDSAGIRPPVLAPAILPDNSSIGNFFAPIGKGSKLELTNLYLLSQRADDTWLGWSSCVYASADSVTLKFRGVIFDGFSWATIVPRFWMKSDVQDCEFRNQMNTGSWFGGEVFRGDGGICLDTTKFINNTFLCAGAYYVDIRGYTPLAVFEHNTVVYGVVNEFLNRQATNMHIKNNIFYASHAMGGNPDHVINGWFLNYPDTASSSTIRIRGLDSVSYWSKLWGATIAGPNSWIDATHGVTAGMLDETKRVFEVKNNDWFQPTKLVNFRQAYNDTTLTYDSIQVPVYGTGLEQNMWVKRTLVSPTWLSEYAKWTIDSLAGPLSAGVSIEKTPLMLDPGFPTDVNNHLDSLIEYIHTITTGTIGPNRWAYPSNHLYPITWPRPENLAYTNTSLQNAGTDGFALGDLNWFPTQKAAWLASLSAVRTVNSLPQDYNLMQNYPNPFNPTTTIEFSLPKQSTVDLKVFNALGQEVATLAHGTFQAGLHSVDFKAQNLASGIYFYRLTAGEFSSVKKMMMLK